MRAAMSLDVEGNEQDAMAMADMFEALDTCPVPVIARVHGAALGGGMGLCAVADVVIAESGTKFGFTETRLGILPAVISPFVVAKIGDTHARALFPGGRRFDAVRAQRIGLVEMVVPHEELREKTLALATTIAGMSPLTLRVAKEAVNASRELPLEAGLRFERDLFCLCFSTEDMAEGVQAFLAKRKAEWRGR